MEVNIVDFPETPVAVLAHRGAPGRLNESVMKFFEWCNQMGIRPVRKSRSFGIAYDDPEVTDPDDFRFDLCVEFLEKVSENSQGVVNGVIPGGRCAMVRHFGSHDRMGDTIYPLYRQWLPESGEELRDFPLFFHYLNLFPEVQEHELVTEVYLPLK